MKKSIKIFVILALIQIMCVSNTFSWVYASDYKETPETPEIPQIKDITIFLREKSEEQFWNSGFNKQCITNITALVSDESNTKLIVSDQEKNNNYNDTMNNTVKNFLLRFRCLLIALCIVIFFLTLLAIYTIRLRKRHINLIIESEQKLRDITNNINGGVLVFLPSKGFHVTYVNEGFLNLIQYSMKEFEGINSKDFVNYIHPEDIHELKKVKKLNNQKENQSKNFSAQLRIKRKDGKYITTIFSGTLVKNSQGEQELYCIVIDISRERAIMDRLEFEQERYKILMEKSDEILYEVDFKTQAIYISKKFKEKFGWALPKKYWGNEIPDMLHIYEEDRHEFEKMLRSINNGDIDGEYVIRVYKNDFTPCWCKIIFHIIQKNGVKFRLIGKLTDIDEEMKEKEELRNKAQIDSLTGLYNKDAFRNKCIEYLKTSTASNNAIIFLDIDNFKEINDTLGHTLGDEVLKDISKKLQIVFSNYDILGRFGGDEFCVLVKDIPKDTLKNKLKWMLEKLRGEYKNEYHNISVTTSAGAVCSYEYGNEFDKLLKYADKALYSAKENGKNSYVLYHEDLYINE